MAVTQQQYVAQQPQPVTQQDLGTSQQQHDAQSPGLGAQLGQLTTVFSSIKQQLQQLQQQQQQQQRDGQQPCRRSWMDGSHAVRHAAAVRRAG